MPAKRHHYLPQFYLRGFLKHNRKQLTVVKIDDGQFFKTDTKNVGIETDWNRVGDDRTSVEEHFAKIDGATSRVLKKIIEDECTAHGFLGHSLNQDCAIMTIYLKRVSDGSTLRHLQLISVVVQINQLS